MDQASEILITRPKPENRTLRIEGITQDVMQQLLERLDTEAHADEVGWYQPEKKLGIFRVDDIKAQNDWEVKDSGFALKKGDEYLELHVPELPENFREFSRIDDSLALIAQYINVHKLKPKYIAAVTYERLAQITRRYGFALVDTAIADKKRMRIEDEFAKMNQRARKPTDMGKILLCYQTLPDFLNRFGKMKR